MYLHQVTKRFALPCFASYIYIYMYIDCKPKADVELVLPDDSLHDSFFLDPAKFKIHVH